MLNTTEVTGITPFGFWLISNGTEYFIGYDDYPIFIKASILDIATVETDFMGNLHWPKLDADIEIAALNHPDNYPLVGNDV